MERKRASHKARPDNIEMCEEKNLFMPIFYSALEITSALSDGEFGQIIRELLASGGKKDYVPNLPSALAIAYKFMLESAIRVFGNSYSSAGKSSKQKYSRRELSPEEADYAEEVFKRALERSSGK